MIMVNKIGPNEKAKVMAETLDGFADHKFAMEILEVKGKDHICGNKTCHGSCHWQLKSKVFDLLYAVYIKGDNSR